MEDSLNAASSEESDDDLQKALKLSREFHQSNQDTSDEDLQRALQLSIHETQNISNAAIVISDDEFDEMCGVESVSKITKADKVVFICSEDLIEFSPDLANLYIIDYLLCF